jgi:hypothetical protein
LSSRQRKEIKMESAQLGSIDQSYKSYIGIKLIEAYPCQKDQVDGYNVKYPGGYESWSPKEQFEMAYMKLSVKNSITPLDLESITAQVSVKQVDSKTSLVNFKLKTGFELYATSSCVDPINYSEELGKKYGSEEINKKIWFALGFVLQWAKYGLKNTPKA